MLSHAIPSRATALSLDAEGRRLRRDRSRAEGLPGGSISFEFHPPIRRQGADLNSGSVPPGLGQGRLRRRLCPSFARRAGARLRRQRVDRRDRLTATNDAGLFAGARRLCNGAFGDERGLAPRTRRAGSSSRNASRMRWGLPRRRCSSVRATSSRSGSPPAFKPISKQARERVRRMRAERDAQAAPGAS